MLRRINEDLNKGSRSIFGFLLESELVAVTALSLSAVSGFDGEGSIALSADFLVAVELLGDGSDSGVHDTSSESEHQVEG